MTPISGTTSTGSLFAPKPASSVETSGSIACSSPSIFTSAGSAGASASSGTIA